MNSNGKSIEIIDEQLNYKIEFKAQAAMPQNQSGRGAGSFEVLINERRENVLEAEEQESGNMMTLLHEVS